MEVLKDSGSQHWLEGRCGSGTKVKCLCAARLGWYQWGSRSNLRVPVKPRLGTSVTVTLNQGWIRMSIAAVDATGAGTVPEEKGTGDGALRRLEDLDDAFLTGFEDTVVFL